MILLPVDCSGPNDNVFVNFVDHGGPGIVAFGNKFVSISVLSIRKKYNGHKQILFSMLNI